MTSKFVPNRGRNKESGPPDLVIQTGVYRVISMNKRDFPGSREQFKKFEPIGKGYRRVVLLEGRNGCCLNNAPRFADRKITFGDVDIPVPNSIRQSGLSARVGSVRGKIYPEKSDTGDTLKDIFLYNHAQDYLSEHTEKDSMRLVEQDFRALLQGVNNRFKNRRRAKNVGISLVTIMALMAATSGGYWLYNMHPSADHTFLSHVDQTAISTQRKNEITGTVFTGKPIKIEQSDDPTHTFWYITVNIPRGQSLNLALYNDPKTGTSITKQIAGYFLPVSGGDSGRQTYLDRHNPKSKNFAGIDLQGEKYNPSGNQADYVQWPAQNEETFGLIIFSVDGKNSAPSFTVVMANPQNDSTVRQQLIQLHPELKNAQTTIKSTLNATLPADLILSSQG